MIASATRDLDLDGTAFARVAIPFLAAVPARWALGQAAGISPQGTDIGFSAAIAAGLLILSVLLRNRGMPRPATAIRLIFLVIVSMAFAPDMEIALLHVGRHAPYRDATLASWDAALGFDWLAYAKAFDSNQVIWVASRYAYNFMPLQVLLAVFVLTGQATRVYAYVAASILAVTACCFVVVLFPALGAYSHAGGQAAGFLHHDFIVGDKMTETLEWLRQEQSVGSAQNLGLISFPSYHAVCAVLGIWAFWRTSYLRWVVASLDLAMLAATLVQGSHYLVDILSGVALGVLSLLACNALMAWRWTSVPAGPSFATDLWP